MAQETQQPSTAALRDNATTLLTQLNVILTQVNAALTGLAISNITLSPTIATTTTSIAALGV